MSTNKKSESPAVKPQPTRKQQAALAARSAMAEYKKDPPLAGEPSLSAPAVTKPITEAAPPPAEAPPTVTKPSTKVPPAAEEPPADSEPFPGAAKVRLKDGSHRYHAWGELKRGAQEQRARELYGLAFDIIDGRGCCRE